MAAELLLHERHQIDGGAFAELKIWRLAEAVRGSKHTYKYSLAYIEHGVCVLRFDNEAGKGDHFHGPEGDRPYQFRTPEKLLDDFWREIDRWRHK